MKWILKWLGISLGMAVVALPAASCRLEAWMSARDELFLFWGQSFGLVPGLPGKYLRKCFYWFTLKACSLDCDIGFLSYFNHRQTEVGPRVYIGVGTVLGLVTLRAGSLIGSRVSIINGGRQHRWGADGRLTACDNSALKRVHIGEETWIGEAAVVMADVGSRCMVAVGSVVSSPVENDCIVGGNPVRFIGRQVESPGTDSC